MAATLETVSGKLDHLITVAEVTASRVERLEDGRDRAEKVEKGMRSLAMRLSAAGIAMSVVPSFRWMAVTAGGSFAGGLLGTLIWQFLHAHAAIAGVLP